MLIISTGTLMYRATTFFRHEPWEEYMTLVGDIELNSRHLTELSLADYTQKPANSSILSDNLYAWQRNLRVMYPSKALSLNFNLPDGLGLSSVWNQSTSYSAARAHFTLEISSVGLSGYQFSTAALLKLTIIGSTANDIDVSVTAENGALITNLRKSNFQLQNASLDSVSRFIDASSSTNNVVYQLHSNQTLPSPVYVTVQDLRGIIVTARYP